MAQVAEADLAAGLFDTALTRQKEVFGPLQAAFIIIIIEGMAIHLLEEILQFAGAHEHFMRQGFE